MICRTLILALLAGLASAQEHHPEPQRPPEAGAADPAAVERGRALFSSSCGFCHGADATGARAPDLVRSTLVVHDEKGDVLAPMIRNGRPDKGMPSFATLKDDQLADIIAFLHHQAGTALHSAHVPGDYPVAKLLTGNAEKGKAFFHGSGGCAACHAEGGDLAGIAKRLSPVDLQQRMVYPVGDKALRVTAEVTLKDGTTYKGPVEHDDEFRIGIRCEDGWYRSWSRDAVSVVLHDPLAAHRALTERLSDAEMHNLFAYLETLQ